MLGIICRRERTTRIASCGDMDRLIIKKAKTRVAEREIPKLKDTNEQTFMYQFTLSLFTFAFLNKHTLSPLLIPLITQHPHT